MTIIHMTPGDDLYLYTDDGLHPNEAGREKIAQTIAERLNKE